MISFVNHLNNKSFLWISYNLKLSDKMFTYKLIIYQVRKSKIFLNMLSFLCLIIKQCRYREVQADSVPSDSIPDHTRGFEPASSA